MNARTGKIGAAALLLGLTAACGADADPGPSAPASSSTSTATVRFPVASFAALSADPVPADLAADLQAALAEHDVTGGGGMSATVMTPSGTWSGTTGKADGVRSLRVNDQFAIASITKSVVSAQVMLLVEAGDLQLDDPVAEHLPDDLGIDTNGATIRQLLGHRSGLPDYYEVGPLGDIAADPERVWTTPELLELVPDERTPPGSFSYAETNYLLLKLVIEHRHGRPLTEALRGGALAVDGLERLVHQPAERPTEPMAMPAGAPHSALPALGGSLPSLANVTAYSASGGIAADSPSLARWWRALCSGEIVSQDSLSQMATLEPAYHLGGYGLGAYNPAEGYAEGFGHTGQFPGYMTWAACLPEEEAVIVVLTNHEVADGHFAYSHGLGRPLVDALRAR